MYHVNHTCEVFELTFVEYLRYNARKVEDISVESLLVVILP